MNKELPLVNAWNIIEELETKIMRLELERRTIWGVAQEQVMGRSSLGTMILKPGGFAFFDDYEKSILAKES